MLGCDRLSAQRRREAAASVIPHKKPGPQRSEAGQSTRMGREMSRMRGATSGPYASDVPERVLHRDHRAAAGPESVPAWFRN